MLRLGAVIASVFLHAWAYASFNETPRSLSSVIEHEPSPMTIAFTITSGVHHYELDASPKEAVAPKLKTVATRPASKTQPALQAANNSVEAKAAKSSAAEVMTSKNAVADSTHSIGTQSTHQARSQAAGESADASGVSSGQHGKARSEQGHHGELSAAQLRRLTHAWLARVGSLLLNRAIRNYPRRARRAHLEGDVVVSFRVNKQGHIGMVRIHRSSGHNILDDAATVSVRSVAQVPAPPPELLAYQRPIRFPIRYRLN